LIDTGSSNTAVGGLLCSDCGKELYNPKDSSSSNPLGCQDKACLKCNPNGSTTDCVFGNPICSPLSFTEDACGFGISYGGGSSALEGAYVTDILCLGEACATSSLGVVSNNVYFGGSPGILGLASDFNACNPTCVNTILDDLADQGVIDSEMFGMCLTPESGGFLDLGYFDSNKYTGSLQYVPVTPDEWYNFNLIDLQIGSTSVGLPQFVYTVTNDVIGTFIDSGTSTILLAPATFGQFQAVYQGKYCSLTGICGKNNFFSGSCFPASSIDPSKYPPLNFIAPSVESGKNVTLTVSADAYLMKSGDNYCLGVSPQIGVGAVLGDVFLQGFYVAYDRVNHQIGFAPPNCH